MHPSSSLGWKFDNSYARLPASLYHRQAPIPVRSPHMVVVNHALADALGLTLSHASEKTLAHICSGNTVPEGADPIAQAYSGHQFGHFNTLGDGRAILLGEHLTPNGQRVDVQLKGSGQTPYSRRGDGRAALAPMLREYVISEAMHALGIPTTRSLAVVTTGEYVQRETLLEGAILTRIAASHVRVGTFEHVRAQGDIETLQRLADYAIARHFPALQEADNPPFAFLCAVRERQAALVARWLGVGFIHGVMNTDNMAISGETIDYGPCAFMDAYDPSTVYSAIDQHGRYAYGNQPHMAQWNLARLAEALLPLLHTDARHAITLAEEAIGGFAAIFQTQWLTVMRAKLGLLSEEEGDVTLIGAFLQWMQAEERDYTNSFRALSQPSAWDMPPFAGDAFALWHTRWKARLIRNPEPWEVSVTLMQSHNPDRIPRNHQVEAALAAAVTGELIPLHALLDALKTPYVAHPEYASYTLPPTPQQRIKNTFCGT
jgi:serine/tyrosine/threonine adenylyltransferase